MDKRNTRTRRALRRIAAVAVAAAMLLGMAPAVSLPAAAADSWMSDYLNTLVSWGVMRGDIDGNLYPDRQITRAEYVTMINRAFGYTQAGTVPFTDVAPSAWYADDIGIAYNVGYFKGTSETTASPESPLTREEAVVLLGRNLMYRLSAGEALGFSDSRDFSEWSRGFIQIASQTGVVSGYEDGTFRPQNNITRGEVATILVRAIGNLINTPGEHTLGSVYGNVTISSPGVELKNTVIAGDLYLTGGVDLGDVLLENVTVLGKIVASGAGESNKGDNSIILRNVTAEEMVVDSISNQFVTIRAEGDTDIALTSVRTEGYLEDATRTGNGLRYIELDGENGIELQLAGNIKEVINLTPQSQLVMAQGSAERVTVDEKATGAKLSIENGARIKELNLDVATTVSGEGDIEKLTVNAAGSTVSMLPDTITIRPGVTANIAGETMDTTTAAESSEDPRLLAGYPAARNVAPTSAEAVFSTNKKATVYWAVSTLTDGSVSESDLISPPAYTGKILKSGSLSVASSKTEVMAKITGLTSDGSYYLSAVMVDSRGQHSPVKVTAFTTPDDSVPKFANGYPYMSKIGKDSAQVAVMPTKTCQLYYAVLPKGSTAPTVNDFRTGSISGHLGYGSVDVTKNVADVFTVNSQTLRELTDYDLYLCLIDADGGQNSGVKKLTFKTIDGTPPVFLTEPTVNKIQATSVGLIANLNEAGTIYWVVVPHGEEYPKPLAGQTSKPALTSDTAKMQVEYGMNALKSGSVKATANRDATITVSGLTEQSAYDLYYVAKDTAGNYSETVKMITIHTLDTVPPTISQELTRTADEDGTQPLSDTDVKIIFSEGVQDAETNQVFYELYTQSQGTSAEAEAAKETLYKLLKNNFTLWNASTRPFTQVEERTADTPEGASWIDYHNVKVEMQDGRIIFTFFNTAGENAAQGGENGGGNICLTSGGTYYFQVKDVEDTSNNTNLIKPNPQSLPQFTTVFAQVDLTSNDSGDGPVDQSGEEIRVDMRFEMHPRSTESVDDSVYYDIFLWSDSIIRFDLYARIKDAQGAAVTASDPMFMGKTYTQDSRGWIKVNDSPLSLTPDTASGDEDVDPVGTSVRRAVASSGVMSQTFPQLKTLDEDYTYEYAIHLTQVGALSDYETWSERVTMSVTIPAGPERNVSNLANQINVQNWETALEVGLEGGGVRPVGSPEDFSVYRQFTDTKTPRFTGGYPDFSAGDATVTMYLQLDRPGTVYYALVPMYKNDASQTALNYLQTLDPDGHDVLPAQVPEDGSNVADDNYGCPALSAPTNITIYNPNFGDSRIKSGNKYIQTGISQITVDNLLEDTIYYAFFVLRGQSQDPSQVYVFRFTTTPVGVPVINLYDESPSVRIETTQPSTVHWVLYANDDLFDLLEKPFYDYVKTDKFGDGTETYKEHFMQEWTTYFPELNTGSADHTTPTVIDALLTSMGKGDDRSVFDEFANEYIIRTVLGNIQTTSGGNTGSAGNGTVEVTDAMGEWYVRSVDCTQYMKPEVRYYFIAAARNVQGTEYSFKAIRNIQVPDREAPEYLSHTSMITTVRDPANGGKTVYGWQTQDTGILLGYTYEGSISITFTDELYWLDPATRQLEKITTGNIVDKLSITPGVTVTPSTVGSTITLTFKNMSHGASIVFFSNGSISDENSNASGKKLTLTFDVTMRSTAEDPDAILDFAQPGFRATWQ